MAVACGSVSFQWAKPLLHCQAVCHTRGQWDRTLWITGLRKARGREWLPVVKNSVSCVPRLPSAVKCLARRSGTSGLGSHLRSPIPNLTKTVHSLDLELSFYTSSLIFETHHPTLKSVCKTQTLIKDQVGGPNQETRKRTHAIIHHVILSWLTGSLFCSVYSGSREAGGAAEAWGVGGGGGYIPFSVLNVLSDFLLHL